MSYVTAPGIVPRVKELFLSPCHNIAFLVALLFVRARLLPRHHPFLLAENYGRFGILTVLRTGAANLCFSWRTADQVALYFSILVGMVIMLLYAAALAVYLTVTPAHASFLDSILGAISSLLPGQLDPSEDPDPSNIIFFTENPEKDVAFIMLDYVFGIPGMFNSEVANGSHGAFPWPMHEALHAMFGFYSAVFMIIAVMWVLYFLTVMVYETAETGTPFGRRINMIWAPLRLVVALGLLIPMGNGLNTAQYILLYTAKFGSGMATNAWLGFNKQSRTPQIDPNFSLVATPEFPDVSGLIEFLLLARTCKAAYDSMVPEGEEMIRLYIVRGTEARDVSQASPGDTLGDYQEMLEFYGHGDIVLRMGHLHEDHATTQTGSVYPYCGEIVVPTYSVDVVGARRVYAGYVNIIQETMKNFLVKAFAQRMMKLNYPGKDPCDDDSDGDGYNDTETALGRCDRNPPPVLVQLLMNQYYEWLTTIHWQAAVEELEENSSVLSLPPEMLERGWGMAGAWYNRIAEFNGAFISALLNIPEPRLYPDVMEQVREQREQSDAAITIVERFNPNLPGGQQVSFRNPTLHDGDVANALYSVYHFIHGDDAKLSEAHERRSDNIIVSILEMMLGTSGVFDIMDRRDVHPMAQLVGMGRVILETSIGRIMTATGVSAGGGLLGVFKGHVGAGSKIVAGGITTLGVLGLTVGIVLFYIIPFMPFMYFFFAVGRWVRSIFEAMVGVPLWALAHVSIEGEGIPGKHGANGYYLLFEIFARPILTVFALIASVSIFSAQVIILHDIWGLVTQNLTGFDVASVASDAPEPSPSDIEYYRGPVDQFFFTVMYAVVVYLMAQASFKLIDSIPNNLMRWMGSPAQSFSDTVQDPVGNLVTYATVGSRSLGGDIGGMMNQAGEIAGRGAGQGLRAAGVGGGSSGGSATVRGTP